MSHPLVVLDIDKTICENGHRIDWLNPRSVEAKCRPIPSAQARIAVMYAKGWDPWFLSARNEVHGTVTMRQLREWLPDGLADDANVDLWSEYGSDYGDWLLMHNAIATFKADVLRDVARMHGRTGCFVGDSKSDKAAAELAGWRFMDARDWRAGQPFVLDGEPMVQEVYQREKSGEDCFAVPEGESAALRTTEVDSAHPEAV